MIESSSVAKCLLLIISLSAYETVVKAIAGAVATCYDHFFNAPLVGAKHQRPFSFILSGMAGTGKTTLIKQLCAKVSAWQEIKQITKAQEVGRLQEMLCLLLC